MAWQPEPQDAVAALTNIQTEVRDTIAKSPWIAGAMRRAFSGFVRLRDQYVAALTNYYHRQRQLARDVLVSGKLVDPCTTDNRPCLFVEVEGLCPAELAEKLKQSGISNPLPPEVERAAAAAALAAFDRDAIYQSRRISQEKKEQMAAEYRAAIAGGKYVECRWQIVTVHPSDLNEPPNPVSLDRESLGRFTEEEYRSIALYRLGGIADAGALRPIVAKPESSGNGVRDLAAYAAWRSRLPISDEDFERERVSLDPWKLSVDTAQQLLQWFRVWVTTRSTTARTPLIERDALELLGRRDSWMMDDLPPSVGVDVLRCLDDRGWIEVRSWHWQNVQQRPDDPPMSVQQAGGWFSPIVHPAKAGPWDLIFAYHDQVDGRNLPHEVRLSERGKAELSRVARLNEGPAADMRALARAIRCIADQDTPPGVAGTTAGEHLANAIALGAFAKGKRIAWLGAIRKHISDGSPLSAFAEAAALAGKDKGRDIGLDSDGPNQPIPRACFELVADALMDEADRLDGQTPPRPAQSLELKISTWRTPSERTKPVSLTRAAGWFKMDPRTLRGAIDSGTYACEQLSPKLYVFDLAEVVASNPDADAEADPTR